MSNNYRIWISSPPHREKLVAEIFFGNIQWAEVFQENEDLEVEFYARPDGQDWKVEFIDAVNALNEAKRRLIGID
jgi:hypothetical protein